MNDIEMLAVAIEEARIGLAEGGVAIGAALFDADGTLIGRGHNRRIQDSDPTAHGEISAFRAAGLRPDYDGVTMVTTLAPCWLCSGMARMFRVSTVVIGEERHGRALGSVAFLREAGIEVRVVDSQEAFDVLEEFVRANPELWDEDSGHQPHSNEDNR